MWIQLNFRETPNKEQQESSHIYFRHRSWVLTKEKKDSLEVSEKRTNTSRRRCHLPKEAREFMDRLLHQITSQVVMKNFTKKKLVNLPTIDS